MLRPMALSDCILVEMRSDCMTAVGLYQVCILRLFYSRMSAASVAAAYFYSPGKVRLWESSARLEGFNLQPALIQP